MLNQIYALEEQVENARAQGNRAQHGGTRPVTRTKRECRPSFMHVHSGHTAQSGHVARDGRFPCGEEERKENLTVPATPIRVPAPGRLDNPSEYGSSQSLGVVNTGAKFHGEQGPTCGTDFMVVRQVDQAQAWAVESLMGNALVGGSSRGWVYRVRGTTRISCP
jgi:hypothetical protein